MNGLDDSGGDLLERLEDLGRAERERARQAGHQAAALDLHDLLLGARIDAADGLFDLLRRALTDERVVLAAHIFDDRLVELVAGHAHGHRGDNVSQGDHSHFCRAAANIDDHAASGFCHRQSCANGSRHGFFNQFYIFGTSLTGRIFYSAAFYFRYTGGNTYDHAGTAKGTIVQRFANEVFEHGCRYVKVSNDAIFQRTNRHNGTGRTANHFFRLRTHGQYIFGAHIDRYYRRFTHDNALALHEYQRICGTQINPDIF